MTRFELLAGCALALCAMPAAARAQDLGDRPVAPPTATDPSAAPTADDQVSFSANTLEYDYNADLVTATGDVRMTRQGQKLRANKVVWNRKTGKVVATGDIAVTNPQGDIAYGDSIELTDSLKDGVVDNMLVVLQQGGRLAAVKGTRDESGTYHLDRAAFSPCAVSTSDGCPKEPTWKITAVKVTYRPDRERVYFNHARFSLFGLTTPALPNFSAAIGESNDTGLLTPSIGLTRLNGFQVTVPVNIALGPEQSLVVAPHFFSTQIPMLETRFSALVPDGAISIAGYATSSRRSEDLSLGFNSRTELAFRGYLDGTARFQFDPNWSLSASLRMVTDRTFLRRYDISDDDRLRTTLKVERIDRDSYLSIAGWAVQTLRVGDQQGLQPVALPEIDYRRRVNDLFGGVLQVQLNSLAIGRAAGEDMQRAFASVRWDMRRLTNWGQEVTFTAFGRADAYNANDVASNPVPSYSGLEGFHTRGIVALAADMRWPFIGTLFGGAQRLTPRVQIVASPSTPNLSLPNEDARAIDLEDSNLFALNRFPGYDRWEDASRITYGADWSLDLPGTAITANIGQSYRLNSRPTILPPGTGLSDRFSDFVGRVDVRVRDFITFTNRFRLDKDNFAARRVEVDATVGSYTTYAMVGYTLLNRNIALEDLQDRESLRVGGRVAFARFWSVFGSAVVDLTNRNEDVLSVANGFDPIRHRLGITYQDDCLELGLTWKRDYSTTGDVRRGNSYLLTLAFKGSGAKPKFSMTGAMRPSGEADLARNRD